MNTRACLVFCWFACTATVTSIALPARGFDTVPFSPEFRQEIEDRFFGSDGRVAPEKCARYRDELEMRRRELVSLFEAEARDRGRGKRAAKRRALRRKQVVVYDLLLGGDDDVGALERLVHESDADVGRARAARILELDHALKVAGEGLYSLRAAELVYWATLVDWPVPTPGGDVEKEARNLYDPESGSFYGPQDLARLTALGGDLSQLGPPPSSTVWRDPGVVSERDLAAGREPRADDPAGGAPVFPPGAVEEVRFDGLRRTQTKPKLDLFLRRGGRKWRMKLKVGGEVHAEPTVGVLLRALGYHVDPTRYVRNLRIRLEPEELQALRTEWRSYYEHKRLHDSYRFDDYFETSSDEHGPFLVAREGVLEAKSDDVYRVGPWPFGGFGHESEREVRGLGLFFVWIANTDLKESENNKLVLRAEEGEARAFHVLHDVGHAFGRIVNEQVNAFPWDVVSRSLTGRRVFTFKSLHPSSLRETMTFADARWMARLIAQFERRQLEDAVSQGGWPPPVARLLLEKLVYRRNQLVETFGLVGAHTPSGPVRLLPADRELDTRDGQIEDGELVAGVQTGSVQDFDSYWSSLLGPIVSQLSLHGVSLLQGLVGEVVEVVLDDASAGIPTGLVQEVVVTLKREVHENPHPGSEGDYWLVHDVVRIGVTLGIGVVARGETTLYQEWQLVRPAGTWAEARFADDRLLRVLLPVDVWRGDLPETYVLARRRYVDGHLRITSDDLTGGAAPLGFDTRVGRALVKTVVVSRKHGRVRTQRLVSRPVVQSTQGFWKLLFVRIPFAQAEWERGRLEGDRGLEGGERQPLASDFRAWRTRQSWLGLARQESRSRLDAIALGGGRKAEDRFLQFWGDGRREWEVFDQGERRSHRVLVISSESGDDATAHVTLQVFDLDTRSSELDGYVSIANSLAPEGVRDGQRLIPFTAALHSANDRWGLVDLRARVAFSPAALERLAGLPERRFYAELGRLLELAPEDLDRMRRRLGTQGKFRHLDRSRVPRRHRGTVRRARHVVRELGGVDQESPALERVEAFGRALMAAARLDGDDDRPVLLATLRALAGPRKAPVHVRITQPGWREKRLVGRRDLVGRTRKRYAPLPRSPLDLDPSGPVSLYFSLDEVARVPGDPAP
ncbi:MAG: hypothetical protein MJE66_14055 [Proteobacteria bacterium]|nr:hypothetical protein [Pseudomonadota bacterium]